MLINLRLLVSFVILSQSIGCAVLVPPSIPNKSTLFSLEGSGNRSGVSAVANVFPVDESKSLPPVISAQHHRSSPKVSREQTVRQAAIQRQKDLVFTKASQQAIQQLRAQVQATQDSVDYNNSQSGNARESQNLLSSSDQNSFNCKSGDWAIASFNSRAQSERMVEETSQTASALIPKETIGRSVLLLTIVALALGGISWPISGRQPQQHDQLAPAGLLECTPNEERISSMNKDYSNVVKIAPQRPTYETVVFHWVDQVDRLHQLGYVQSVYYEISLCHPFAEPYNTNSSQQINDLELIANPVQTADLTDAYFSCEEQIIREEHPEEFRLHLIPREFEQQLGYGQKPIGYSRKRANCQLPKEPNQERGLIPRLVYEYPATQLMLSCQNTLQTGETQIISNAAQTLGLIKSKSSSRSLRQETPVSQNQQMVATLLGVRCRNPVSGFVVLFDSLSESCGTHQVFWIESYAQPQESCIVANVSHPL